MGHESSDKLLLDDELRHFIVGVVLSCDVLSVTGRGLFIHITACQPTATTRFGLGIVRENATPTAAPSLCHFTTKYSRANLESAAAAKPAIIYSWKTFFEVLCCLY